MINTKIAMSSLSILASFAIMAGATFAFFTSTATSNDNTFSAGNLTLALSDLDENQTANATLSFGATGLVPGDTEDAGWIELENTGSTAIAEVELSGAANTTNNNGDGSSFVSVLGLTVMTGTDNTCSGGTDITGTLATVFGDGFSPLTVAELGSGEVEDVLPGIASGSSYFLCFDVTLPSSAGNEYQNDAGEIDLTFTANQDASQ